MKLFKRILLGIFSLVVLVIGIGAIFLKTSPQFGGEASEEDRARYAKTGHYNGEIFLNEEEIVMEINCHSITQMIKEFWEPDPQVAPKEEIAVQQITPQTLIEKPDSLVRLTWFGHSTFLVEINGMNLLLDPIFGQVAAPHPLLGRKRFNSQMPISINDLPPIDAIIISHDHYDHLDYPSINQLKNKTEHFFVPMGVENHLESWDIAPERIHSLDWWEETTFKGLTIACTPSRHMSGRAFGDQSATLWGSWVIKDSTTNIYFSGDGGYGRHFKKIGERYGPFDIGLMECGQYNVLWKHVHMMPEETVMAGQDVKAKMIVPIHWGSFILATHSWIDPALRVTKKASEVGMPISTPRIGEPIVLGAHDFPHSRWWEAYEDSGNLHSSN